MWVRNEYKIKSNPKMTIIVVQLLYRKNLSISWTIWLTFA